MVSLLDPADPEVRAAGSAARETLVRLEAAPFIALIDAALAWSSDSDSHDAALPGHASTEDVITTP
jgi:hypothetical protein